MINPGNLPMRAYLITSSAIFGLITLAHIARLLLESSALATDPVFLLLTGLAAGLSLWGGRLAWRLPRP